ncbi:MAG: hypothetical protein U5N55_02225 [Cypionkella sp.]|nr:hypothetical protein [Cypionkella sp.]
MAGRNVALIGDGTPDGWEVFQFANAVLPTNTYDLSQRLRGQAGSDGQMAASWPAGAQFVLPNSALRQIPTSLAARGLLRQYRVGLLSAGYDGEDVLHQSHSFLGMGLRPYSVGHLRATVSGATRR